MLPDSLAETVSIRHLSLPEYPDTEAVLYNTFLGNFKWKYLSGTMVYLDFRQSSAGQLTFPAGVDSAALGCLDQACWHLHSTLPLRKEGTPRRKFCEDRGFLPQAQDTRGFYNRAESRAQGLVTPENACGRWQVGLESRHPGRHLVPVGDGAVMPFDDLHVLVLGDDDGDRLVKLLAEAVGGAVPGAHPFA